MSGTTGKKLLVTANISSACLIVYFSSEIAPPWKSRGVNIFLAVWMVTGVFLAWAYESFLRRLGPKLVLAPVSLYSTFSRLLTTQQQEIIDPAVLIPISITLALFCLYERDDATNRDNSANRDPFATERSHNTSDGAMG